MTVRRFDPLRDLLVLQERMNRLFEDSLARSRTDATAVRSTSWAPVGDAYETMETIVFELELAGVDESDVQLQVHGDHFTVTGRRRVATQGRADSHHRVERSYGPFVRTFTLSSEVDPERVTGELRDGVLRVELRKVHARPERERVRSERGQ